MWIPFLCIFVAIYLFICVAVTVSNGDKFDQEKHDSNSNKEMMRIYAYKASHPWRWPLWVVAEAYCDMKEMREFK